MIGGVDWSDMGISSVRDSEFTATVGWHVMDGAWSLVMLYDYHHGYDFNPLNMSSYSVLTRENIDTFDFYLGTSQKRAQIDFRAFTRSLSSYHHPYDFSLEAVLNHLSNFNHSPKVNLH